MKEVDITVTNCYCPFIIETFRTRVDISDLNEVEMTADECCGQYLDMHHDYYQTQLADLDWDTFTEGCVYVIEEVAE